MKHPFPILLILLAPNLAFAQSSLQNVLNGLLTFIDGVLIPFLFGVAFLFFIFNIIRYLVLDGGNEEARDNAKNLALYGLGAFVFLIIFWGIVNLVVDSIGVSRQPVQVDYVSGARTRNLTDPGGTTPATETDDMDLSVDDIADPDPEVPSTDSPSGCISFSLDGICLDPAPAETQTNLLADSFRESVTIVREVDGQSYSLGPITNTPNSTSYEITNEETGTTFRVTYTSINIGPGNDDYMLRIEELRRPGDTSTTPPRWTTLRFTYNESTNQMDIFTVSNTTVYEQNLYGTAFVNNQGQVVMRIVDRYGRETISTVDTWITRTLQGDPSTTISDNTTPTPDAVPPNAPTPDYTVR